MAKIKSFDTNPDYFKNNNGITGINNNKTLIGKQEVFCVIHFEQKILM